METAFDSLPDDLRLHFQFCSRRFNQVTRLADIYRPPFTIITTVVRGEMEVAFAERGRKAQILKPGDVIVLPANLARHARALSSEGVEYIASAYLFEIRGGVDLLNFYVLPEKTTGEIRAYLGELIRSLLDAENRTAARSEMQKLVTRQRIGYALLESLLDMATPKPGLLALRRILPAIEILNEKFREPPDFEQLVAASGLSRTHFFRAFKSHTGLTPGEYVKRRRLREAALLLQESGLTVAEIGAAVGWPDQFHFSKLFKAALGLAPTGYREQYRRGC